MIFGPRNDPWRPKTAKRRSQDRPKHSQDASKWPQEAPRGSKRFHLSPQINVSQLCSMLVIFVIETTFASSQEAINKVQEVSKINISEPPSFRASTPLSLQVPRRDSRSANNYEDLWPKTRPGKKTLIGLKKKSFENSKSKFWGCPEGFEYFGPHIRIPRETLCI